MSIESASGIDEQTARFEIVPKILDNASLQLPAFLNILHAPFLDGTSILSEHTFTRTRHICENHIKLQFCFLVIARIVISDKNIWMSEFLNVFGQDVGTCMHRLITEKHTSLRKSRHRTSSLSARSRTRIEHQNRLLHIGAKNQVEKHRGGLLYIIGTCMKQRVESEVRPIIQVETILAPRNIGGLNSFFILIL